MAAGACQDGASNIEDITHLGSWLKYVARQKLKNSSDVSSSSQVTLDIQ